MLAKLNGTMAHGLFHGITLAGIFIHFDFDESSGAQPGSQLRHESLNT